MRNQNIVIAAYNNSVKGFKFLSDDKLLGVCFKYNDADDLVDPLRDIERAKEIAEHYRHLLNEDDVLALYTSKDDVMYLIEELEAKPCKQ